MNWTKEQSAGNFADKRKPRKGILAKGSFAAVAMRVPLNALLVFGFLFSPESTSAQTVVMEMIDDDSGEPVSARLQWKVGEKRVPRPRTLLYANDWWLASPQFPLTPRGGEFEFIVHRGPEFTEIRGGFEIQRNSKDVVQVEIPRSTNMHEENWFSADHSSTLLESQTLRWQRADAVDLVSIPESQRSPLELLSSTKEKSPGSSEEPVDLEKPASKPKKEKEKLFEKLVESSNPSVVGYQLRAVYQTFNPKQGKVRLHRVPKPVDAVAPATGNDDSSGTGQVETNADPSVSASESKSDSSPVVSSKSRNGIAELMEGLANASAEQSTFAELIDPWSRDTPILLSSGEIRAVQILSGISRPEMDEPLYLNNAKEKDGVFAKIQKTSGNEKATFPVFAPFEAGDRIQFKGSQSAGRMAEKLYWQMLESGLRLTSTAASDFGVSTTHLGYNRTYFYAPSVPSVDGWSEAIRLGQTTVTNGPLLRAFLNDRPPGTTITSYDGKPVELLFQVSLTVREPVDYLDVIFNGETLYSAKLEEHYSRGEFPPMSIDESGWLVIRVVTAHEKGYRLASTSPFYFVFNDAPRISKRSVEFMLGWLANSEANIQKEGTADVYAPWISKAREFWSSQLSRANAP